MPNGGKIQKQSLEIFIKSDDIGFSLTPTPLISPHIVNLTPLQTGNVVYGWPLIGILMTLALKQINYKASIIGILMMLALKNINYKASIIGIFIMLALNNINHKASIIGILIMVAFYMQH